MTRKKLFITIIDSIEDVLSNLTILKSDLQSFMDLIIILWFTLISDLIFIMWLTGMITHQIRGIMITMIVMPLKEDNQVNLMTVMPQNNPGNSMLMIGVIHQGESMSKGVGVINMINVVIHSKAQKAIMTMIIRPFMRSMIKIQRRVNMKDRITIITIITIMEENGQIEMEKMKKRIVKKTVMMAIDYLDGFCHPILILDFEGRKLYLINRLCSKD
ncbi:hypothetical protein DFH28DRAFT_962187 [Melampsora americana]|nr:hypothetical protein DFH28DRAFT_962187 [Melampsora americana]